MALRIIESNIDETTNNTHFPIVEPSRWCGEKTEYSLDLRRGPLLEGEGGRGFRRTCGGGEEEIMGVGVVSRGRASGNARGGEDGSEITDGGRGRQGRGQ